MREADRDLINLLLSTAVTDASVRRLLLQGSRHDLMEQGVPTHIASMISEARARSIEELARTLLTMAPELDDPRPWHPSTDVRAVLLSEPAEVT